MIDNHLHAAGHIPIGMNVPLAHIPLGSIHDVRHTMDENLLGHVVGSYPQSYVYFCFWHDEFDAYDSPNRILINSVHPTVMDVCAMIKAIFFPGELVILSLTVYGSEEEYFETDLFGVPTHRGEILVVKVRYDKNVPKLLSSAQLSNWLKENHLPEFELTSKFLQHKVSMESLKYMKHQDLIDIGIKEWGLRADVLQAIKKTFETLSLPVSAMQVDQQMIGVTYVAPQATKRKLPFETTTTETPFLPTPKRPKPAPSKNNTKIKFKDLRSLVMNDMIPVDIGSPVRCSGSTVYGVVVRNKQKKPVIRYMLKTTNKKKTGTISQFYKDATAKPLQAKGDSWSNIFFTHLPTGITLSLQGIHYLIKGPKKVVSAFLYFAKEIREQVDAPSTEFAKKSGELWRALSNEEKKKYKMKELIDKERFTKEKDEWTRIHQYHQNLMELHMNMRSQYEMDFQDE
jgi:hypothetical protein